MELKLKKKLQVLRMFSDLKDFDYEPPNMQYDKKTGDIKIVESKTLQVQAGKAGKPKKIISSMNDLERERSALYAEMGLDEEGKPKNDKEPIEKMSERLKTVQDRMLKDFDIDPTAFHVFSRDFMRVDVGLLI
jgi:hypothetical protein